MESLLKLPNELKSKKIIIVLFFTFLSSLLFRSSLSYTMFAILGISGALMLRFDNIRISFLNTIKNNRLIFYLILIYSLIFLLTLLINKNNNLLFIGEIKWVIFIPFMIIPIKIFYEKFYENQNLYKTCLIIILIALIASFILSIMQSIWDFHPFYNLLYNKESTFYKRAHGFMHNPISFSHISGSFFMISLVGFLISFQKKDISFTCLFFLMLTGSSLVLSLTRGAWLAALISIICLIFILSKDLRKNLINILIILGIIISLIYLFNPSIKKRVNSIFDKENGSNNTRIELWKANYKILKDNPLGIGYRKNITILHKYIDESNIKSNRLKKESLLKNNHAHHEFIDIAVGTGWIGLILYLLITLFFLIKPIKILYKSKEYNDYDKNTYLTFLLLSSILVQLYINLCMLTDQLSTSGRLLLCLAWIIPIVVNTKVNDKLMNNARYL